MKENKVYRKSDKKYAPKLGGDRLLLFIIILSMIIIGYIIFKQIVI